MIKVKNLVVFISISFEIFGKNTPFTPRVSRKTMCVFVRVFGYRLDNLSIINTLLKTTQSVQNEKTQTNDTSVVRFLRPPCLNSGVLMRMSQSTTKIVPDADLMTFSSCMSLK